MFVQSDWRLSKQVSLISEISICDSLSIYCLLASSMKLKSSEVLLLCLSPGSARTSFPVCHRKWGWTSRKWGARIFSGVISHGLAISCNADCVYRFSLKKDSLWSREEAERQAREREREAREREARERDRKLEAERERRLREEKERERRERERVAEEKRLQLERAAKLEHEREQQKRKQDEMKWEREQSRMLQQQRLGKRASGGGYQDSPGYDMAKRQSVHDIRGTGGGVRGASASGGGGGGMDLFDLSSSVFSRLDQQKQVTADGRSGGMQNVSGMMQGSGGSGGGKNSSMADSYSRRSAGDASGVGGGGYRQGSGGYGGGVGGAMGRERHMETGVTYPIPSLNKSVPTSSPGYQKSSGTIGGGVTVLQKGGGLSRQNHDIISAALANIQKSVSSSSSISNQMRMPGSSPIQQMSSAAHMSAGGVGGDFGGPVGGQVPAIGGVARQMMGGGGGMGGMAKPPSKLPPEGERYNRRFSRPPHGPRQANMKRF